MLAQAWPVAAAVDIAAGYYVLRLIYPRGSQAFPFLLVTGIAANTVGLVVLALRPEFTPEHVTGAVLVLAALGVAVALRAAGLAARGRSSSLPAAFRGGGSTWRVCIRRWRWYPSCRCCRIRGTCWSRSRSARRDRAARGSWVTVAQVVLFFFGLVNGGAMLRGYDTGTWAVLLVCSGRPAGMVGAVAVGRLAGLRLPTSIAWHDLVVIALAMSSGFTFALFTASTLLPVGGVLTQIRLGALATAVGAAITYGVARGLRVGRFAVSQGRAA